MDDVYSFQQTSLDFFFDIIKWVFNDFLLRVTIFGVPVLWFFIALIIISVVITGVVNRTRAGVGYSASRVRRNNQSKSSKKG